MSQAMTNIVARMRVRNLHPSAIEKRGRFNLRPRCWVCGYFPQPRVKPGERPEPMG